MDRRYTQTRQIAAVKGAALIYSVGELGVPGGSGVGDPNIYVEPAAGFGGPQPGGLWAAAAQFDGMLPIADLDGLEVWSTDADDDADHYSLYGDPFWTPPGGVSQKVAVWQFNRGVSTPHTFTSDLAMAIDRKLLGGAGDGDIFSHGIAVIDVDALMVQGKRLTVGLAPVDFTPLEVPVTLDGGEIFEYDGPGSTARFVRHGHLQRGQRECQRDRSHCYP